jgi:pSer/pThr/pTyr-binding forkhead associated (FHA) protein
MIADSKVSRKHAQITNANGLIEIEDLGSSNGTKVDGNTVAPGNKIVLTGGEKISFAGVEMTFQVPGSTGTNSTQAFGGNKTAAIAATPRKEVSPATLCWGDQEFALKPGLNTFGRKSENDVAIADPYICGKHGTIEITDQGIFITDIGSTNGMSLNDARLSPNMRTVMTQEDTIKIGAIELKIRLNA